MLLLIHAIYQHLPDDVILLPSNNDIVKESHLSAASTHLLHEVTSLSSALKSTIADIQDTRQETGVVGDAEKNTNLIDNVKEKHVMFTGVEDEKRDVCEMKNVLCVQSEKALKTDQAMKYL